MSGDSRPAVTEADELDATATEDLLHHVGTYPGPVSDLRSSFTTGSGGPVAVDEHGCHRFCRCGVVPRLG
jgi:hypothetical protein